MPLPEGFILDPPSNGGLPPGFVLDAPPGAVSNPNPTPAINIAPQEQPVQEFSPLELLHKAANYAGQGLEQFGAKALTGLMSILSAGGQKSPHYGVRDGKVVELPDRFRIDLDKGTIDNVYQQTAQPIRPGQFLGPQSWTFPNELTGEIPPGRKLLTELFTPGNVVLPGAVKMAGAAAPVVSAVGETLKPMAQAIYGLMGASGTEQSLETLVDRNATAEQKHEALGRLPMTIPMLAGGAELMTPHIEAPTGIRPTEVSQGVGAERDPIMSQRPQPSFDQPTIGLPPGFVLDRPTSFEVQRPLASGSDIQAPLPEPQGGQISFAAPAEARAIPSARQQAVSQEQPMSEQARLMQSQFVPQNKGQKSYDPQNQLRLQSRLPQGEIPRGVQEQGTGTEAPEASRILQARQAQQKLSSGVDLSEFLSKDEQKRFAELEDEFDRKYVRNPEQRAKELIKEATHPDFKVSKTSSPKGRILGDREAGEIYYVEGLKHVSLGISKYNKDNARLIKFLEEKHPELLELAKGKSGVTLQERGQFAVQKLMDAGFDGDEAVRMVEEWSSPAADESHAELLQKDPALAAFINHMLGKPMEPELPQKSPFDSSKLASGVDLSALMSREKELRGETFAMSATRMLVNPKESGFTDPNKEVDAQQLWNRVQNKAPKAEVEIMKQAGVDKDIISKGKISPVEAARMMSEKGPRVEVRVLRSGAERPASPEQVRLGELQHWKDGLPQLVQDRVEDYIEAYHDDPQGKAADELFMKAQEQLPERINSKEFREKMFEYGKLSRKIRDEGYGQIQGFDPDTYRALAPKDKDQTVVMVRVPVLGREKGAGRLPLSEGSEILHEGHHFGSEDRNVLGWARLQYETLPDGRKVAHVIEVQSDWGQQAHEQMAELKKTKENWKGTPEEFEEMLRNTKSINGVNIHPLLKDYNRLVLKAVIDQARKDGAEGVVISDSKTAMLSEGQDLLGNVAKSFHRVANSAKDAREAFEKEYPEYVIESVNGSDRPGHYDILARGEIPQRKGMELNYDQILPSIAKELTGEKGEKVSFGGHQRAFNKVPRSQAVEARMDPDAAREFESKPRENLIFRNESGQPKTDASGTLYSLDKLKDLSQRYSLFEKDRPEQVGSRLYSGINLSSLFSGQRQEFKYRRPVEFLAGAPEWTKKAKVESEATYSGLAAGPRLYQQYKEAKEPGFDSGSNWFRHAEDQPGVVFHKKTGKPYMAMIMPKLEGEKFTVEGKEATPEQLADIKKFAKGRSDTGGEFRVFDMDKTEVEKGGKVKEFKDLEGRKFGGQLYSGVNLQDFLGIDKDTWSKLKGASGGQQVLQVLRSFRSLAYSMDLSAVLRQNGLPALSRPIMVSKAFGKTIGSVVSEAEALKLNEDIYKRPNASLYERDKLDLTTLEKGPATTIKREEHYQPSYAELVPGVRMSERQFVAVSNKVKADYYDALVDSLGHTPNEVEGRAIANGVNILTGRADVGDKAQAMAALALPFGSPRLVLSRFQVLLGKPMWQGTMQTRLLFAKEYARILGGALALYGLGKLAGGTVNLDDPKASDFGKVRFGDTTVDPLAGLNQVITFGAQFGTGERTTRTGMTETVSPGVTLERFLRTKFAPVPSALRNMVPLTKPDEWKDVVGNKVTPGTIARDLTVPLSFRDVYQAMQAQGVEKGTALGMLSLLGMGVNTLQKTPTYIDKLDEAAKKQSGKPYFELPLGQRQKISQTTKPDKTATTTEGIKIAVQGESDARDRVIKQLPKEDQTFLKQYSIRPPMFTKDLKHDVKISPTEQARLETLVAEEFSRTIAYYRNNPATSRMRPEDLQVYANKDFARAVKFAKQRLEKELTNK